MVDRDVIDAACLRAIATSTVDEARELSRRHRWQLLAVDVDHDGTVAVVLVATRGKRQGLAIETHLYDLDGDGPRSVGWTGAMSEETALPPRPSMSEDRGWIVPGTSSGDGISFAHWQLPAEVGTYRLRGVLRPVPWHGWILTVWRDDRRPSLELYAHDGEGLGELPSTQAWPAPIIPPPAVTITATTVTMLRVPPPMGSPGSEGGDA